MSKRLFYFGVLALMIVAVFASCRSEKSGCNMSKGYAGYGH
jgi:hypothetical protein